MKKQRAIKHPLVSGLTEAIILKQNDMKVNLQSSCLQHVSKVTD